MPRIPIVRRRLTGMGTFLVVIAFSVLLTAALRAVHTEAQDGLPTPEGQLGGSVSLSTRPAIEILRTPPPRLSRIPNPSECQIEPRTIDGMLALAGAPIPPAPRQNSAATPAAAMPAPPSAALPPLPTSATAPNGATQDVAPANTIAVSTVPPAAAIASPLPTATALPDAKPATVAMIGQIKRTVRELVACGNAGDLLRIWAFFTDDFVRGVAADQGALFNGTVLLARSRAQLDRRDPMPSIGDEENLGDGRLSARVTVPAGSPIDTVASRAGVVEVIFIQENGRWRIDEISGNDGTGGP